MLTHLQYGKDGLEIEIPSNNVTTLAPRFIPGLPDEAAAFREAVRVPINSNPLRELIGATSRARCRPTGCLRGSSPNSIMSRRKIS
jgi:lactate racemase-like protein